jgi:CMP-2-keto-3-deoxyoctulosonic acid synthetase
MTLVSIILMAGSLSMVGIVQAQAQERVWYAFVQPVALVIYFIGGLAGTMAMDILLMGALVYPIRTREELLNPSVVKVVVDKQGFALYFSRSPMPYVIASSTPPSYYKHIGPYAYRTSFLVQFTTIERGPLEQAESLEQLRALENGYRIRIIETRYDSQEVDTPEDLEGVRKRIAGVI